MNSWLSQRIYKQEFDSSLFSFQLKSLIFKDKCILSAVLKGLLNLIICFLIVGSILNPAAQMQMLQVRPIA